MSTYPAGDLMLDDACGLDGRRQRSIVDGAAAVALKEQVRHVGGCHNQRRRNEH